MRSRERRPALSRRSTRLRGFDYASNAGYVITICSHDRKPLFGTIEDGRLLPSPIGTLVEREWSRTGAMRPGVLLDAFILMPNHLHGIVIRQLPDDVGHRRRTDANHTGRAQIAPTAGRQGWTGRKNMAEFVQVVTTTDSKGEAQRIAEALVRRRVAGCVQVVGPISSTYWWNEEVETAEEWLCLIKTAQDRYDALEQAIREVHSYDVPEILAMPVIAGHAPYLAWLRTELGKGRG